MKNPKKCSQLIAGISACALFAGAAEAATVTAIDAAWPTTTIQSVDALADTFSGRGVTDARVEKQSFRVSAPMTVDTIYFSGQAYGDLAFTIDIFQTTDTLDNAANADESIQIGSTITVNPFGSTGGQGNIEVALDGAEQFTLAPLAGPAGYVIRVETVGNSGNSFTWAHSFTGVDLYPEGQYRRDDGSTSSDRDFGVAFVGVVPEPSTSLLALGGLLAFGFRRRK